MNATLSRPRSATPSGVQPRRRFARNTGRAAFEFYPTPPEAVRALLSVEQFDDDIWEPACGDGAISRELEAAGHSVISTDLIDRGYGQGGCDFLKSETPLAKHIITNPPYGTHGLGDAFVRRALMHCQKTGGSVAMLLNLRSLCNPSHRLGVALLRVSTDKQFQDGESIENQRRKVEFVARRERIDIVRFFTEHYSGRKTDRQIMDDLFAFLAGNPDIETVIVGDIDRFTRGGSEVYLSLKRRLRELDVALVDTTGIIQPERNRLEHMGVEYPWSIETPSRYAEVFMAEKARAEASDILTRTIGQEIRLVREGYQCRVANFGYPCRAQADRAADESGGVTGRQPSKGHENDDARRTGAPGFRSRGSSLLRRRA